MSSPAAAPKSTASPAGTIADREAGSDDATAEGREAIRIDLSHDRLPGLADRRLIEYDRRSGAIGWARSGGTVETLLSRCRDRERDGVSR